MLLICRRDRMAMIDGELRDKTYRNQNRRRLQASRASTTMRRSATISQRYCTSTSELFYRIFLLSARLTGRQKHTVRSFGCYQTFEHNSFKTNQPILMLIGNLAQAVHGTRSWNDQLYGPGGQRSKSDKAAGRFGRLSWASFSNTLGWVAFLVFYCGRSNLFLAFSLSSLSCYTFIFRYSLYFSG